MKLYVVNQVTGEWDSAWSNPIFVTDKEYKAKFYCSKANAVLSNYRDFYREKLKFAMFDDDMPYSHYSERNDFVVGSFSYSEIQFKSDIKTV